MTTESVKKLAAKISTMDSCEEIQLLAESFVKSKLEQQKQLLKKAAKSKHFVDLVTKATSLPGANLGAIVSYLSVVLDVLLMNVEPYVETYNRLATEVNSISEEFNTIRTTLEQKANELECGGINIPDLPSIALPKLPTLSVPSIPEIS